MHAKLPIPVQTMLAKATKNAGGERLWFSRAATILVMAYATVPQTSWCGEIRWRGVNIAGAEFAADRLPGRVNFDYHYPYLEELQDAAASGARIIRLPFLWERLQPALGSEFSPSEQANLQQAVQSAKALGLSVILDLHNYGAFRGQLIGTERVPVGMFADVWRRLARLFANDDQVWFGLMNEPNKQSARQWADIAQAALLAIRAEKANNWILVPGTRWSGAHSWNMPAGGSSNAEALQDFRDPMNRELFEMHQYFDMDSSGTHSECVSKERMIERLQSAEAWLAKTGRKGFLGEFGVSSRPDCLESLRVVLAHLENSGVWRGWTYWAASAWFGNYMFNAYPSMDTPQGRVLKEYFNLDSR